MTARVDISLDRLLARVSAAKTDTPCVDSHCHVECAIVCLVDYLRIMNALKADSSVVHQDIYY